MLKVSSYMYLAVLAIIDTLVLYNGLLRIWLVELIGFDYQGAGNWICKITVAFGYVSSDLSVWLIIAVTVERYIVVCFPFQASSMCNVSRARKVIVGLFLLMLVLNVHFLWTAEIIEEHEQIMCRGGEHFRQLVEEIWPWVDTLIYSFLPFLTITILNVFIIREVAGAHSNRARLAASESETSCIPPGGTNASGGPAARRGNTCEGTRLTALLLTVSFTFLLLTLPNNIALIVSRFWNQKYDKKEDQMTFQERKLAVHGMAKFKLLMTIAELLMYTNHSINFFLYCATGNKFRQQVLDLLRCLRRHGHRQTPAEQTITSYSVRKTSQSWCSEMTLAKLNARRRSSCVSSEDADKMVNNDVMLDGQPQSGVKTNVGFTTGNVNSIRSTPEVAAGNSSQILNMKYGSEESSCRRNMLKEYEIVKNTCSDPCQNHPRNDTEYIQPGYLTQKHCGNKAQQRKSILRSWISHKVYNNSKKHKQILHAERGRAGSDCVENEYILLKPTVRWCESTTKC
ncbi:unnamed protein product [Candidula unifasciata]|uniref:G-protein coupled receptors family 1 profile domain-containing protein n=1 Tax=Candidula unifasciata TaxID=100452 RepID=A0A8S3YNS3_9EUPU|nr:unnamed protein product [Candidula unifasciata]